MYKKVGKIVGICISAKKGERKKLVSEAEFIENYGIKGDAHASSETHRQISLLSLESIQKMKKSGLNVDIGSFAENIAVSGFALSSVKIGDRLKLGKNIILKVTQIGKECHRKCSIFYKTGACIMPKEGVFAKVISGGILKKGDDIKIQKR